MCVYAGTRGLHHNTGRCLSSRWGTGESRPRKEGTASCTASFFWFLYQLLIISILFVHACVCVLEFRDGLCGGSVCPVALQSGCPRPHHAPLCPSHTQRHFYPEHNADWLSEGVGGYRWGTKALGWVTELGKIRIKRVCSCHPNWSFKWFCPSLVVVVTCAELRVILSTHWPPPSLFLPCGRTEQQPALCADCSLWVSCLWMLAIAMCHVLRILSLSVFSVNSSGIYGKWCLSVCQVICREQTSASLVI